MADLNVKGNKSFSSNYFRSNKFVSMHATTNHPRIVTLNEMLSMESLIVNTCYLFPYSKLQ